MTRSRWKMMAGGLTLALGGLAAVAGAQSQCGGPSHVIPPRPVAPVVNYVDCNGQPVPAYTAVGVTCAVRQPPAEVPPPAAPTLPPEPAPAVPAVSTPADLLAPPVPATAEKKPGPEKKPEAKDQKTLELTIPAAAVEPVVPAPTPATADPPKPQPLPVAPEPARAPAPPAPAPQPARPPEPAGQPADPLLAAPAAQAPAAVEKKLKVMLHMGDDRPRFEVRDGDEVYLKVICDKVDVKSPSDRGEAVSVLKATGRVAFVTPGGDGSCEELTLTPGTGQVVVVGNASFKYNWGKAETTVIAEKLTFRLGSAPGSAPATPATVPAGFRATR